MGAVKTSITDIMIKAALDAGKEILAIYQKTFEVDIKEDGSPITEADRKANKVICEILRKNCPSTPILSEENKEIPFSIRKEWKKFFLIDPIDGTKEFINKNGEFTVNIAYCEKGSVIEGVVFAPVLNVLYYTKNGSAYKRMNMQDKIISAKKEKSDSFTIVYSRSHSDSKTVKYIAEIKQHHNEIKEISLGSSLKLCLVAEGIADLYPRLVPTKEWDTAAAHAIVNASGGVVKKINSEEELRYNREDIENPFFFVASRYLFLQDFTYRA